MLWQFSLDFLQSHNSISTIVCLCYNGIYIKPTKFCHMQPYGLSTIRLIMPITGLHIVCVYTTHCIKYILFPIKIA